ncbi:transcription factor PIF1-like [Silene latifolia]|uniref:transcription factor PIF1-like n=1 Tax=Silene latifolia TaxID=37657 RepID=UPI003D778519
MMFNDDYEGNDVESYSLIQQSCCVPSIMPSSQSFLALPEMPLQSDMQFLSDFDNNFEDLHANTSIIPHVQDRDVPQNQGQLTQSSGKVSRDTRLKRSRHEVHNISEKRRRSRINEKLKTLQELMPHCKKTDKASILEEAAKKIRALQHQAETMAKRQAESIARCQYMPFSGNPELQFPYYVPIQQVAGTCVGCYAPCTPFFQLPSPSSAVASFCFPTTRPLNGD